MAEILVNQFLTTLPAHVFAYVPFWEHLRLPKKIMGILLAVIQLVYMAVLFILLKLGFPLSMSRLISIPIYGIPFFLSVRMELGKIGFLYIFTTDYLLAIQGTALFIARYLLPSAHNFYSWQYGCLTFVMFIVVFPFMVRFFRRTTHYVFEIDAPQIWRWFWLLPFSMSMLVLISTFSPAVGKSELFVMLSRNILLGCMFLLYHYIIQLTTQLRQQAKADEQIRQLERLTRIHSNQYSMLQSHIRDMSHARHDLRQHIRTIQGCLDSGDMESLRAYVKMYGESLPMEKALSFCSNQPVNAILNYYASKAAQDGIDMEVSVDLPQKTLIPESELCVLIGNLLENALNACTPHPDISRRFIHVRGGQSSETMLTLAIDNTSPKPPVYIDEKFVSSKREGFGLGTESVRAIAEKYNGDTRFEWKDGIFYVSVMLNP